MFKKVRWSLSGTNNFYRAASAYCIWSLGLKKILGTESIDTIVKTSFVHPNLLAEIIILDKGGSTGNYAIHLP